jgi:hypothetical protein
MRIANSLVGLSLVCLSGCGIQTTTTVPLPPAPTTQAAFNIENAPTVDFVVPEMVCKDCCHDYFDGQDGVVDVKFDDTTKVATVAYNAESFDEGQALAKLRTKYPQASLAGVESSGSAE